MMFVTFFIGILDISSGKLVYCNAGHNAPVAIGDDAKELEVKPNIAIGISPSWDYADQRVTVKPGTSVLLYTDGLTEAENQSHELFGMERLMKTAEDAKGCRTASETIDLASCSVHAFVDGAEQSDDLTLLVIRYR